MEKTDRLNTGEQVSTEEEKLVIGVGIKIKECIRRAQRPQQPSLADLLAGDLSEDEKNFASKEWLLHWGPNGFVVTERFLEMFGVPVDESIVEMRQMDRNRPLAHKNPGIPGIVWYL